MLANKTVPTKQDYRSMTKSKQLKYVLFLSIDASASKQYFFLSQIKC